MKFTDQDGRNNGDPNREAAKPATDVKRDGKENPDEKDAGTIGTGTGNATGFVDPGAKTGTDQQGKANQRH